MSIKCPNCNKIIYSAEKDEFIVCDCGHKIYSAEKEVFEQLDKICNEYELKLEEEKVVQIRKMADKIVAMILSKDFDSVDIEIEKAKLKLLIENVSPEKEHLYELIYEPRFKRLWEQFREES